MRCSVEPAHEPARGALPAWCVVSLLVLLVAFPLRRGTPPRARWVVSVICTAGVRL